MLDFLKGLLFWRGRKKGIIHTMDITFDDVKAVFFPKNFREKYRYLGSVPYNENSEIFKAMYPLVLAMDYEAKPSWCPRWVLRFLYLFGSDNSIARIRNRFLHINLQKLTKGYMILDYKTKWEHYDLRISIHGPSHLQNLSNDIEYGYYSRGKQKELAELIRAKDPNARIIFGNLERLQKQYLELLKED